MNNLNLNKQMLGRSAWRAKFLLSKHSPEILLVGGIAGVIASTVLACKATLKAVEIIEQTKEIKGLLKYTLENEPPTVYNFADYKKDLTVASIQGGVNLLRVYAPAIGLGTLSIAAIIGGHKILTSRNVALLGAYKILDKAFEDYRQKVIDTYGTDDDYYFRGLLNKPEQTEKKKGKSKKDESTELDVPPCEVIGEESIYARFFDSSSLQWQKENSYNLYFLKAQQQYANNLLQAHGHVFLNEVYDALGIPRSPAGAVVGWLLGHGDDYIDFGLMSPKNNIDAVNGYREWFLLDFNVDGPIWDLI